MNEKQLSQALRDAEKAHAEYEKTLGHKDENWPDFYAHYIATNFFITSREIRPDLTIAPNDGSEPFKINKAQFDALERKFNQDPDGSSNFFEFRKRARQGFDCLMIYWCGMWLGIEKDGYTHS